MKELKRIILILLFWSFIDSLFALEVAITVDDLPIAGELPQNLTRTEIANKMLAVFKKHHITGVYGLINGVNTNDSEGWKILQTWVKAGQLLGNHTFIIRIFQKATRRYCS